VYTYELIMKKDIHPSSYRPVVFQDLNNGDTFITQSTVAAEGSITIDGIEYPLVKIHISRTSHPFFTGEERIVDIEGRVDKFKARAAAGAAAKDRRAAAAQKLTKRAAAKAAKAADSVTTSDSDAASEPSKA
jgi:large subunit ribosomal protein L31